MNEPVTSPPADRSEAETSQDRAVEKALFAKRQQIYTREVHGLFAVLRTIAVYGLLAIYYGLPWLRWDGRQAVLFDLPARKFHIFGLTFWPQDFLNLALLLIIAALSLFFFTALAGRLWCGYACPQTVWTELFVRITRMVEGGRFQQIRLDKLPRWHPRRLRIKAIKHGLWLFWAFFTGFTFVAYFTPATDLLGRLFTLQLGPWETFWIIFYTLTTYGNAGWMREQVCIYMCPYARFQSAMFDRDTLIVSYDPQLGEPRGPRRASADYKAMGLGDCTNCKACVMVCPTGIDIRNGLQYQCIGCSACIDACDQVMERMNYPKGLISYTTLNALEGKPTRVLRPRVLVYGTMLLLLFAVFTWNMSHRVAVDLDVIRDRNQLYRETAGLIENVYTLKIMNMDDTDHRYRITATGIDGLGVRVADDPILVRAGQVHALPVALQADEDRLADRSTTILITVSAVDNADLSSTREAKFLGPAL